MVGAVPSSTTIAVVNGAAPRPSTPRRAVSGATAGIGASTYDGTHQTKLREDAVRDTPTLRAQIEPALALA